MDVGPLEPGSAAAWIRWADEIFGELRRGPATELPPSPEVANDMRHYIEQWKPWARSAHDSFRWHGEIHPDHVEYLVHALFSLDAQLSDDVRRGERSSAPEEARDFYLVLVRALLHALETDSPGRAAFVEQLRSSWPIAVAAI